MDAGFPLQAKLLHWRPSRDTFQAFASVKHVVRDESLTVRRSTRVAAFGPAENP